MMQAIAPERIALALGMAAEKGRQDARGRVFALSWLLWQDWAEALGYPSINAMPESLQEQLAEAWGQGWREEDDRLRQGEAA